jgi:hypothetical protein
LERSLELAVRDRLSDYVSGRITIDDFKTWLVASTWSLARTPSSPGLRLADEIKLSFAEHSSGYRSDEELRQHLVDIASRIPVDAAVRD